jgi:NADH-quinone oxidoreductase subunit G
VCPVGALTDKTFRFKQRVWFTKPVNAHRECDHEKCTGHVTLWYKGKDVLRVTARKDEYGEVKEWICNECRFEKKETTDWVIEGPAHIERSSVISANHYELPVINPQVIADLPESTTRELEQSPPLKLGGLSGTSF